MVEHTRPISRTCCRRASRSSTPPTSSSTARSRGSRTRRKSFAPRRPSARSRRRTFAGTTPSSSTPAIARHSPTCSASTWPAESVTTYLKVAGEYNEVEGIFPDGEYTLVESSREQLEQNSNYIDIWKLKLEPNSRDFTRVTHWGEYPGYKASNPVVSSDGRRIAFQSARSKDPAGVGYGIFVMTVPGSGK